MRRQFLNSAKVRSAGLVAASTAALAAQLALTGPASASPTAEAAGVTVQDTVVPAGSAGVIHVTTPNDENWQIYLDLRGSGFGQNRGTITWDGSTCVLNSEFLHCTPTAGQFHIYLHVPAEATVGGTVLVTARQITDTIVEDTGTVTIAAPVS